MGQVTVNSEITRRGGHSIRVVRTQGSHAGALHVEPGGYTVDMWQPIEGWMTWCEGMVRERTWLDSVVVVVGRVNGRKVPESIRQVPKKSSNEHALIILRKYSEV